MEPRTFKKSREGIEAKGAIFKSVLIFELAIALILLAVLSLQGEKSLISLELALSIFVIAPGGLSLLIWGAWLIIRFSMKKWVLWISPERLGIRPFWDVAFDQVKELFIARNTDGYLIRFSLLTGEESRGIEVEGFENMEEALSLVEKKLPAAVKVIHKTEPYDPANPMVGAVGLMKKSLFIYFALMGGAVLYMVLGSTLISWFISFFQLPFYFFGFFIIPWLVPLFIGLPFIRKWIRRKTL